MFVLRVWQMPYFIQCRLRSPDPLIKAHQRQIIIHREKQTVVGTLSINPQALLKLARAADLDSPILNLSTLDFLNIYYF